MTSERTVVTARFQTTLEPEGASSGVTWVFGNEVDLTKKAHGLQYRRISASERSDQASAFLESNSHEEKQKGVQERQASVHESSVLAPDRIDPP